MHDLIAAEREALAALCRRFGVLRLEVFGSAARGTDFVAETSDADLLVSFVPDRRPGLADLLDLEEALSQVLRRPVDLVEREAIEASRNYIRRRQILAEVEPVYEG
jgi:uncharacterized protein